MFVPIPEIMIGPYWRVSDWMQIAWNKVIDEVTPKRSFVEYFTKPNPNLAFWQIFWKYSEKGRYYHNPEHIFDCLKEFEGVKFLSKNTLALEMALIGHDVIYDPKAGDNEMQSANLMGATLIQLGANRAFVDQMVKIILATDHKTAPKSIDEALAIDIDLSIFGKPDNVFENYDKKIRQEYSCVPWDQYCAKRAQVLRSFLDRPQIYHTDYFRQKYEDKARMNLGRTIHDLERNVQKGL